MIRYNVSAKLSVDMFVYKSKNIIIPIGSNPKRGPNNDIIIFSVGVFELDEYTVGLLNSENLIFVTSFLNNLFAI